MNIFEGPVFNLPHRLQLESSFLSLIVLLSANIQTHRFLHISYPFNSVGAVVGERPCCHQPIPRISIKIGDKNDGPLYLVSAPVRVHLHTKRQQQLCNDTSNSVLIENNGVIPEWTCNPFPSDTVVFNENRIASFIPELLQR